MRKLFTQYTLFIGLALTALACNGTAQQAPDNVLSIADTRNGKSAPDYGTPSAGDVIVERTFFIGDGYLIAFYPEINGEVKEYSAFQEDPGDYDEAHYEWTGASTVRITLVNSDDGNERILEAWADGSTTGIRDVE